MISVNLAYLIELAYTCVGGISTFLKMALILDYDNIV